MGHCMFNVMIVFQDFVRFVGRLILSLHFFRLLPMQMTSQLYTMGVGSLILIVISGLFIGLVFAFQMYIVLNGFGSLAQLSQVVAFGLFRELSPVVTGLLIAGRIGSTVAAELGQMKQAEQIDSLLMWGINPYAYLMWPRLLSLVVVTPILVFIFDAVSIYAACFYAVIIKGMESQIFWTPLLFGNVFFQVDVLYGIYKAIFFGCFIGLMSLYQGAFVERGSSGIAKASTQAVVLSSVGVLMLDYILSQIFY
jgi:phospholipid/cholesterol/gamma-HCH transport system permease protein